MIFELSDALTVQDDSLLIFMQKLGPENEVRIIEKSG